MSEDFSPNFPLLSVKGVRKWLNPHPTVFNQEMKMLVRRTVKVPVHHATTKSKLHVLDKLTAKLTYGVRLWSELIEEHGIRTKKELQRPEHQHLVREQAGLSAGFVQQCGNRAFWMWESYRELHAGWRRAVERAKRKGDQKRLQKLLKREPSKPFHNSEAKKIPTRFDYRTGRVERSERAKLSPWLVRISTLKKRETIKFFLTRQSITSNSWREEKSETSSS